MKNSLKKLSFVVLPLMGLLLTIPSPALAKRYKHKHCDRHPHQYSRYDRDWNGQGRYYDGRYRDRYYDGRDYRRGYYNDYYRRQPPYRPPYDNSYYYGSSYYGSPYYAPSPQSTPWWGPLLPRY